MVELKTKNRQGSLGGFLKASRNRLAVVVTS
jgi:hypothetical protein